MKKLFIIFLSLFVFIGSALSAEECTSSDLKTLDASILSATGSLCGVLVITDGSNDAAIRVYDNKSAASGTTLFYGKVAATSNFGGAWFGEGLSFSSGIYVDVTGTNASYIVYYRKK